MLLKKKPLTAATNYALFGGGIGSGIYYWKIVDKYAYSNDTRSSGTDLTTERYGHCACGSVTDGYFFSGWQNALVTPTEKYNYSTGVVSQTTKLSNLRLHAASAGNNIIGVICGGDTNLARLSSTEKFTYSTQSTVDGTSLSTSRNLLTSVGNINYGVFSLGNDGSRYISSEKYIYGSDARTMGTSLTISRNYASGLSTGTFGLFIGGTQSTDGKASVKDVEKYIFSTEAIVTNNSLALARCAMSSAGNTAIGILALGSNGYTYNSTTEKILYSNMSWVTGTSLPTNREQAGAVSSYPGWVA